MSPQPVLHVGIGKVGRETIHQITTHVPSLRYAGLFDKLGGLFASTGLTSQQIEAFPADAQPTNTIAHCIKHAATPPILIDTTATEHTVPFMKEILASGGAVVMSNKKPLTGLQTVWDELHALGSDRLLYETTVGAGLPVITTLKSLLATGDEIVQIQGCFSGTLGYLFSELEQGTAFSTAVQQAKDQGFTEPDPRDDLAGTDVARKVLILSRLIGKKLEIDDILPEKLYDESLAALSPEEFMAQVGTLDASYAQKAATAKSQGEVLRYVATVSPTEHHVRLQPVPLTSDIGCLKGPDNIVVIKTKRYFDNPLIIKGPGAGIAVTAAGVVADAIAAAQVLKGASRHAAI